MPTIKGKVRRTQLVTTYGVGALVAVRDESFMVAGLDQWPSGEMTLHEPRLESRLQVRGFREPPASDERPDMPVIRFPRWHSCPKCKRLADHRTLAGTFDSNTCARCNRTLVPSRFVVVCAAGHISDFPYVRWVHDGKAQEGISHELYIDTRGETAGLKDIVVRVFVRPHAFNGWCVRRDAFTGHRFVSRPTAMAQIGGSRLRNRDTCAATWCVERVVRVDALGDQHSPVVGSCLPALNSYWTILRAIPRRCRSRDPRATRVARESSFSIDDLVKAVQDRKSLESTESTDTRSRRSSSADRSSKRCPTASPNSPVSNSSSPFRASCHKRSRHGSARW